MTKKLRFPRLYVLKADHSAGKGKPKGQVTLWQARTEITLANQIEGKL